MNSIVLALGEAVVTLYPAGLSGEPLLDLPIWSGEAVDNLSVKEKWLVIDSRPSGALHPIKRPLIPQYEIVIGRVWALRLSDLLGFQPGRGQYVLDVTWQEEDSGQRHRRTFYGVTISERGLDSREADREFTDQQNFEAQYFVRASAPAGEELPVISGALPVVARYISDDGSIDIYNYDPVTQLFTEVSTGISNGRAKIGYFGTSGGSLNYRNSTAYRSGSTYRPGATNFKVQFVQASAQVYRSAATYRSAGTYRPGTIDAAIINADGTMHATQFVQGAPRKSDIPRLDFVYGNVRIASVTPAGKVFGWNFDVGTPLQAAGAVAIVFGDVAVASLAQSGCVAKGFES